MRFVLGILSGLLGMLAGWFGLAMLVASLAGPDRDGGIAMGAFFEIGPIGGVVGFVIGVWLFIKIGLVREDVKKGITREGVEEGTAREGVEKNTVREGVSPPGAALPTAAARPARTRISRPFAVAILALVGGLAWCGWYELIRSPYLTHGFMTLNLQFKLPSGSPLPSDVKAVHIDVREGDRETEVMLGESWHGHEGDRQVILASATLMMKTGTRTVSLELPGLPAQTWQLDLSSDPDPTAGYTRWRVPGSGSSATVEMSFRLSADR